MKYLFSILIFFAFSTQTFAQKKGSFTDSRDGKSYKTVAIGTQVWMAENLAFDTDSGCWAYSNSKGNLKKYGYLYNHYTAKTACPYGWHLPSAAEWEILAGELGGADVAGNKLKSVKGWNKEKSEFYGTDESGFSALPGGERNFFFDFFSNKGVMGFWWSSTEYNVLKAYKYTLTNFSSDISKTDTNIEHANSVRCVKD